MASAALLSLLHLIDQILPNLQSYFLLCSTEKMKSLQENLVFLQEFLQNFPKISGHEIDDWETQIRDVSSQAQDIIESHVSRQSSRDEEQVNSFEASIIKLNSIVEEARKLKESWEGDGDGDHELPASTTSLRHAPTGKETMVGVDEDLLQIKDRVTGEEPNLQIIPITGMGGVGKTTLARSVYDDQLTVDYFDVRHWVTISQEYRVHEILGGILSMKGSDGENVESLVERVYKSLKGRRYLIVMDDIWHAEAWYKVRRAFPDDYNGSRVIITTRLSDEALNIDSNSPLHQMRFLNEDQSWALLRDKVYAEEHCPDCMEKIGKSIARSCKGLPLAIVVIAGVLKAHKTREYWKNFSKSVNLASAVDDDRFSGIFSLSYINLPHHLKPCFLYMGVFPEDYEIPVKKLIKLWVADGFLEPITPMSSLEELAAKYLEDLIDRNLVLVTKKRSNGRIRCCGIHDSLRDLSLRKGQEEKFLQHFPDRKLTFSKMVKEHCRLSIRANNLKILGTHIQDSSIHSLLYFCPPSDRLTSFTSRFTLLRVVGELLVSSSIFPCEILELVNLRYLSFTHDHRGRCNIPSSISKLQNLQTLIVNPPRGMPADHFCELILPLEIWKMPELRHLVLMKNTYLRFPYGKSCSVLENLQTLSNVMNFNFTKDAVESFPNLKKLRFRYRGVNPEGWGTFCLGNLVSLQELEELNFRFPAGSAHSRRNPLATNIAFPQKLKKLTLTRSGIPWQKMTMVGSLPNLEVLKLKKDSFVGREWEPNEGEFLALKYLEIENTNLVQWSVDSTHFPVLEKLIIRWCYKLKEVPSSVGDIPTLQMLTMRTCTVEAEESVRRIRDEQHSSGNDALKVWIHYPSEPEETKPEQSTQNKKRHTCQSFVLAWPHDDARDGDYC